MLEVLFKTEFSSNESTEKRFNFQLSIKGVYLCVERATWSAFSWVFLFGFFFPFLKKAQTETWEKSCEYWEC